MRAFLTTVTRKVDALCATGYPTVFFFGMLVALLLPR